MDYEEQYNNRNRVPEHPQLIEGWALEAARYRADAPRAELGLSYGDTARQVCDIFRPASDDDTAPLFLFIHGGYWQALDSSFCSHFARGLNDRGFTVAVPSYDLCPDVDIATIIDQMRHCCAWLWHRHHRPIVVFGHSAAGHLAAAMLATDWPAHDSAMPRHTVPAALAISGLFELEPLCETTINDAVGMTVETARDASPLYWQAPAGTSFEAHVGELESEEFHRQSMALCLLWNNTGVDADYVSVPGTNHFTVVDGLSDPDSAMVNALVALAE